MIKNKDIYHLAVSSLSNHRSWVWGLFLMGGQLDPFKINGINWYNLANPRDVHTLSSSQVLLRTPRSFPPSPLPKTNQSPQGHYGLVGIVGMWVLIPMLLKALLLK